MTKQFSLLPKIAALSVMAAFAAPVMAQSAGSNVINVGWFHLAPQDSSEGLTTLNGPLKGYNANSHSSVGTADTLGIALTHFFTDNIAVTADLGIPPKFKLTWRSMANWARPSNGARPSSPSISSVTPIASSARL